MKPYFLPTLAEIPVFFQMQPVLEFHERCLSTLFPCYMDSASVLLPGDRSKSCGPPSPPDRLHFILGSLLREGPCCSSQAPQRGCCTLPGAEASGGASPFARAFDSLFVTLLWNKFLCR